MATKNWQANRRFHAEHPGIDLPPASLMHDPYGMVNYSAYWAGGRKDAGALAKIIDENDRSAPDRSLRILEWGCGPGRIIRHLPDMAKGRRFELYGCDYNRNAIAWCQKYLPEITFATNNLAPPLSHPAAFFDYIYCISVFTHLSEPMHHAWMAELGRILKPGGRILLSLHGDYYRRKLLPDELAMYDSGGLVVREGVAEGGRMYTAFHGEKFVREHLLVSMDVLRHYASDNPVCLPQDLWLVRKPGIV